jgi:hypothetical protein
MLGALSEFRIKPGANIITTVGGLIQPITLPLVW